ncbi:MAG: c-type cytochrome biogenesis protein CcmI [Parashewanella sp.]
MMTTFWIFTTIFIVISFGLIWLPFLKKSSHNTLDIDLRHQANLDLFKEKLAILEQEQRNRVIDEQEFTTLKKELEITLLQDVKQGESALNTNATSHHKKNPLWPMLMSLTVLSLCGYLYNKLGAYEILSQTPVLAQGHENMTKEQIIAQELLMMEQQVKTNPKDSETWFSLGHAYMSLGRYDDSIHAFDQAISVDGNKAELLGPKATAMFYRAGQQMSPAIQTLIDQALKQDPNDPATLLLVGMNAFFDAKYQNAINAWKKILANDAQGIDREAVLNAIAEAKKRMEENVQPTKSLGVEVEINIAPEFKSQISKNETLFVFARTSGDKVVPIAATKLVGDSFPLLVKLDQHNELGTGVSFADVKQVNIIALLSKSGKLKAQKGDLQGRIANIKVGGKANLMINKQID